MKRMLLIFWAIISVFQLKSQIENGMNCKPIRKFIPFESMSFIRNDTAFVIYFYPSKEKIDSTVSKIFATKLTKNSWITDTCSSGSYAIVKFKKVRPSQCFKENNGKLFQADAECICKSSKSFYPNGNIEKYWRCGTFSRAWVVKPK